MALKTALTHVWVAADGSTFSARQTDQFTTADKPILSLWRDDAPKGWRTVGCGEIIVVFAGSWYPAQMRYRPFREAVIKAAKKAAAIEDTILNHICQRQQAANEIIKEWRQKKGGKNFCKIDKTLALAMALQMPLSRAARIMHVDERSARRSAKNLAAFLMIKATKKGKQIKKGEWLEFFRPGMTIAELADAAGTSYNTAYKAAKRYNLPVKKLHAQRNRKFWEEVFKDGMSTADLAKAANSSLSAAIAAVKRYGLPVRKEEPWERRRKEAAKRCLSVFRPGMTISELAEAAGVSYTTARKIAKEKKLPILHHYEKNVPRRKKDGEKFLSRG